VWIAILLLTAASVGSWAAFLAYVGGADVATTILTAGGASGGTASLMLAIIRYAEGRP
jgi:hypothetical protein